MEKTSKIKDILYAINWKIIILLLTVPFLGDIIDYLITRSEPYDDIGDYFETGLELFALGSIGIYVSYKRKKEMQAEEAFKESESRFRSIYESSPIGIVMTDTGGKFHSANPAFIKMLGYTEGKLKNMAFSELSHPGEIEENLKYFKEMIEGKRDGYRMEKRYYHKDGSIVWGNLVTSAIHDANGEFLYNFAMVEDITERKQTGEALKDSEEKYKTLFNSSSDAIFIINKSGRFIEVNDIVCERLGYSREELLTMSPMDMNSPQFAAGIPERMEKILQGEHLTLETEHVTKDGRIIPVEIVAKLVDYSGEPAILAVARDITEREKAEEQLERIEKLESLGLLAGGIAHDFNNLLGAILGNIELAAKDLDKDSRSFGYLAEGQDAILRAKDLTQQLLTFSKGGAPIRSPESIERIIKDSADFVLHGSKTRVEYDFDENLNFADVDSGQISQVIQNLVINADQAMPQEGTLSITAENSAITDHASLDTGDYIKITIKDSGIGIPKKHLKNIFDPYFSTKQTGSGLGLAIVHSIINAHDGYVSVESTLGKGTAFTIFIPSVDRQEGLLEQAATRYEKGTGQSVLFLEDDKNVAITMAAVLEELGYSTDIESNGKAAVKLYKQRKKEGKPFDLVITDLTIPGGIGGEEVNRQILEFDPDARTIATSGYTNDTILANYKEYGYKGVLKKPVKIDEIGLTLYNALKK